MLSKIGSTLTLLALWVESGHDVGWGWSRQQFKLPLSCAGSSKLLSSVGDFLKWRGENPLGSVDICLALHTIGMGGPCLAMFVGGEQLTCAMLSNGCE